MNLGQVEDLIHLQKMPELAYFFCCFSGNIVLILKGYIEYCRISLAAEVISSNIYSLYDEGVDRNTSISLKDVEIEVKKIAIKNPKVKHFISDYLLDERSSLGRPA